MINFIYTIIICLFNSFGWYDLGNKVQQDHINAPIKNAYVYSDRLILSVADFHDYYRFSAFLSYLGTTKGTDFINSDFTYTYTNPYFLDNNELNALYFTDAYRSSNMVQSSPDVLSTISTFTLSRVTQPPTMDRMGYYKYSFTFKSMSNTNTLYFECIKYLSTPPTASGTLLDNPTYMWTYEHNSDYFYNALGSIFRMGIVIKNHMNNDMFNGWRNKGLPEPVDYQEAYESGYEQGYGSGVNDGYNQGLDFGNQQGYQTGYSDGNTQGYQTGYASGLLDGQSYDQTALTIFTGIIEVGLLPVNIFLQMFNYEIFGINISGVVSALLTISIVIIIVRFLLGKKDD